VKPRGRRDVRSRRPRRVERRATPKPARVERRAAAKPAADEPAARAPAPDLTSRERKSLRGRAHPLEPVVLVGQHGVTDAVLRAVDEALWAHELVKVRLREPEDKQAAARDLATGTDAALCGLVGHTVILYRPHPETPRIVP
jgi:RNA-binding protein